MGAEFKHCTDEYLIKNYVPDIYQESIMAIDYEQLVKRGVKLISFDMDDTIAGFFDLKLSRKVVTLFENLKKMGLEPIIITNNGSSKADKWAEQLGIEKPIKSAEKPRIKCFENAREMYNEKYNMSITEKQMAHVGNSIINDIGGAKAAGVYSCLVRDEGNVRAPQGITTGHKLRVVLHDRKIWRKHHKYHHGDQYYQLEEGYRHQKW